MLDSVESGPKKTKRDFNAEPDAPWGPNCVSFVLKRLGVLEKERFIKPGRFSDYEHLFSEVDDSEQANVVGILVTSPTEHVEEVLHLGLIDPKDRRYVLQRRRPGSNINREKIDKLFQKYPQKVFRKVFLKAITGS